jgi:hypothetical protein
LPWECEWNGEERCIELRTEAAAARAGRRVFELSRRLRSERAARLREMEGRQSSCMLVDVDVDVDVLMIEDDGLALDSRVDIDCWDDCI